MAEHTERRNLGTIDVVDTGRYRYVLSRHDGTLTGHGTVLWIMLNPSTADAHTDDPTIRRCIRFTREWGYQHMRVVNLYALRATDPSELKIAGLDTVGPHNDGRIEHEVRTLGARDRIVCAWGGNADPERARQVLDLIHEWTGGVEVRALAVNADGTPRHPLYVPADTEPVPFPITPNQPLPDAGDDA